MKMSTQQSGTADDVNSMGERGKGSHCPNDGHHPLQLVNLHFTSFEITTNLNELPKFVNVLVIVDHFNRYTRVYVTKDQKAFTAVKILYEGFISILGTPKRILTDQDKLSSLLTL